MGVTETRTSAAAPSLVAGLVRTGLWRFALFDAIGAVLWSGVAVGIGWIFRDAVNDVLAVLAQAGHWGLVALAVALALYLAVKWVRRQALNPS